MHHSIRPVADAVMSKASTAAPRKKLNRPRTSRTASAISRMGLTFAIMFLSVILKVGMSQFEVSIPQTPRYEVPAQGELVNMVVRRNTFPGRGFPCAAVRRLGAFGKASLIVNSNTLERTLESYESLPTLEKATPLNPEVKMGGSTRTVLLNPAKPFWPQTP